MAGKVLTIKVDIKAGLGHQSHIAGCGVHNPKPKRKRTRQAANAAAIKEQL